MVSAVLLVAMAKISHVCAALFRMPAFLVFSVNSLPHNVRESSYCVLKELMKSGRLTKSEIVKKAGCNDVFEVLRERKLIDMTPRFSCAPGTHGCLHPNTRKRKQHHVDVAGNGLESHPVLNKDNIDSIQWRANFDTLNGLLLSKLLSDTFDDHFGQDVCKLVQALFVYNPASNSSNVLNETSEPMDIQGIEVASSELHSDPIKSGRIEEALRCVDCH